MKTTKLDVSEAMPALTALVEGEVISLAAALNAMYALGFSAGVESGRNAEAEAAKNRATQQALRDIQMQVGPGVVR